MKKFLAILLALSMIFALAACSGGETGGSNPPANNTQNGGGQQTQQPSGGGDDPGAAVAKEITLWTYPIGNWGQEAVVNELTAAFEAETGIKVTVEYLDYTNGDDKTNTAISSNNPPDIIMEGPERLVANYGVNGHMVDLSDMFDSTDRAELSEAALTPCIAPNGAIYEYPLVMTAHCLAINVNAFEEAGALQYVDLESHTWTTENFFKAVQALYDKYGDTVAAVYCGGQGGDQGTRAIVNSLYGGSFTNDEHTAYTWDDPLNIKALEALYAQDGIAFDASIAGGDEIALFYQGVLKMAFCWNAAQQLNPNAAGTGAGKTMTGDDIAFMAFPTESGTPVLEGGVWGFGIFDNGDAGKIEAAKQFIKYMCDSSHTAEAVKAANYFPARSAAEGTDLTGVWADNDIMNEYTKAMLPYMGPYHQVTTGWAEARTQWWNMLQKVGEGADIATVVAEFAGNANAAAG